MYIGDKDDKHIRNCVHSFCEKKLWSWYVGGVEGGIDGGSHLKERQHVSRVCVCSMNMLMCKKIKKRS